MSAPEAERRALEELRWCAPFALDAPLAQELAAAYATPPRHYHGLAHVAALARGFAALAAEGAFARPREVFLALLFHDAVQGLGTPGDEEQSAALARGAPLRHPALAGVDGERAAELVRLTARHGALAPDEVDGDAALFLDLDLAILAAPEAEFDAYDAAIRREWAALPEEAWRAGRGAFAERLLARPVLFLSERLRARYEERARENLRRLVARLLL